VDGEWLRWRGRAGEVEVALAGGHEVVALPDGEPVTAAAVRLLASFCEPLRMGFAVVYTARKTDLVRATGFPELDAAFTVTTDYAADAVTLLDDAELRARMVALLGEKKLPVKLRQAEIELVVREPARARALVRAAIDVVARLGARARELGFTVA